MHRSFPIARTLATLLVAVGLLAGSLEIHTPHPLFEGLETGSQAIPTVSHPHRTSQVESARLVVVPPCPACLLHLQTSGAEPVLTRSLTRSASRGWLAHALTRASHRSLPRSGPSRAPPAS